MSVFCKKNYVIWRDDEPVKCVEESRLYYLDLSDQKKVTKTRFNEKNWRSILPLQLTDRMYETVFLKRPYFRNSDMWETYLKGKNLYWGIVYTEVPDLTIKDVINHAHIDDAIKYFKDRGIALNITLEDE